MRTSDDDQWRRIGWAHTLTGTLYNGAAVMALLIGGIWTMWEYGIHREGIWSLQITLTPHMVPADTGQVLVTDVFLENIGKTVVRAHPQKRCIVTYWRVDVPTEPWTVISRPYPPNKPLAEYDLLEPYYDYPRDDPRAQGSHERYELEPKAKYHEVSMITAKPGENILVKLQFYEETDPDPMTEYVFFHVPGDKAH